MKARDLPNQNGLVCVVDDELSIRESLSFLLRSAGLKVRAFASAQEFLTNQPLDSLCCLVLDVQLPEISGLDLQQSWSVAVLRSRLFLSPVMATSQ